MSDALNITGILLSLIGTAIAVRGTLTSSAAVIKQRWSAVNDSWKKQKPSWFHRFSCHIARKFGSDNPLDTENYIIESFIINFWTFILLLFGFIAQLFAVLISSGLSAPQ